VGKTGTPSFRHYPKDTRHLMIFSQRQEGLGMVATPLAAQREFLGLVAALKCHVADTHED